MNIRLEEVTRENLRAVCLLKVSPEQEDFVMPNSVSIAQSKYWPDYHPRAIYRDDLPVGFAMYSLLEPEAKPDEFSITRLMIDQRWQREGIGRKALELTIKEIRRRSPTARILIYYEPENFVAKRLYAEFGFVEVDVDEDGEVIAELRD